MHNLTERGHPPASSKPAPDQRRLLDHATDAILTIGTDGTLGSLNPAFEAITGLPREEWVGKPFHPLVHPEDLPLAMDLLARALDGEPLPAFDLRILASSGLYLVGEFTASPLREDGRVIGVLAIGRDDPMLGKTEYFSGILWSKNIWHALRIWDGWMHDWPYWRDMILQYIGGHD